jgi:NTE family protein
MGGGTGLAPEACAANDGARTALILTGGGARAGYQAGVLKAIRESCCRSRRNPVSHPLRHLGRRDQCRLAGGLCRGFRCAVWTICCRSGRTSAPIRSIAPTRRASVSPARAGCRRWPSAGLTRRAPRSLLDNSPLRPAWRAASTSAASGARSKAAPCIRQHHLLRLFVGAERQLLSGARRPRRLAPQPAGRRRARITLDHLMASSAIPFIFPAVHINREWFGDGSMRQVAPVSPAIHLGADKILVIGAGRMADENARPAGERLSLAGADRRPCLVQHLSRQHVGRPGTHEPHQPHLVADSPDRCAREKRA